MIAMLLLQCCYSGLLNKYDYEADLRLFLIFLAPKSSIANEGSRPSGH